MQLLENYLNKNDSPEERVTKTLRDIAGELNTLKHTFLHSYKFKKQGTDKCDICVKAGTRAKRKRIQKKAIMASPKTKRRITSFGDVGPGDSITMTADGWKTGVGGFRYLHTHYDLLTESKYAIPVKKLNGMDTLRAMNFIYGDFPRRIYRSDNWKSLENAAKAIGLVHEPSQPGQGETNGVIEAVNGSIESMSRKAQLQAGMPACWWPFASPTVCFLGGIIMDENNECAYYEKHGVHFPGKIIPFGCLVYFMPSPARDERHETEPALQAGVFLGYRQGPGGIWQGDYIVAPLEQFE